MPHRLHVAAALLASSLSTLLIGGTLRAEPDEAAQVERVSYADLDLTSPAGQTTLRQRMDAAAYKVCGYDNINRQCRQDVLLRNKAAMEAAIEAAKTLRSRH